MMMKISDANGDGDSDDGVDQGNEDDDNDLLLSAMVSAIVLAELRS